MVISGELIGVAESEDQRDMVLSLRDVLAKFLLPKDAASRLTPFTNIHLEYAEGSDPTKSGFIRAGLAAPAKSGTGVRSHETPKRG